MGSELQTTKPLPARPQRPKHQLDLGLKKKKPPKVRLDDDLPKTRAIHVDSDDDDFGIRTVSTGRKSVPVEWANKADVYKRQLEDQEFMIRGQTRVRALNVMYNKVQGFQQISPEAKVDPVFDEALTHLETFRESFKNAYLSEKAAVELLKQARTIYSSASNYRYAAYPVSRSGSAQRTGLTPQEAAVAPYQPYRNMTSTPGTSTPASWMTPRPSPQTALSTPFTSLVVQQMSQPLPADNYAVANPALAQQVVNNLLTPAQSTIVPPSPASSFLAEQPHPDQQ